MYYNSTFFNILYSINIEFKQRKYRIISKTKIENNSIEQSYIYTHPYNETFQYIITILNSTKIKTSIPINKSNILYITYHNSIENVLNYIIVHLNNIIM